MQRIFLAFTVAFVLGPCAATEVSAQCVFPLPPPPVIEPPTTPTPTKTDPGAGGTTPSPGGGTPGSPTGGATPPSSGGEPAGGGTTPPPGPTTGGGSTGGSAYDGPAGSGTTPGPSGGASGGTSPPPSGGSPPSLRRGATTRTPGAGPAPRGRTTPRARGKSRLAAWNAVITVPWRAAFPARTQRAGYDGRLMSVDASLRVGLEDGGWQREPHRPSVVVIYDASRADHRRAVRRLGEDDRFAAASHLFNCFRVDARVLGGRSGDVRLRAYDRSGVFVTEVTGTRKVRGAFDALEKAWNVGARAPLAKVLPRARGFLVDRSVLAQAIKRYEGAVVCPDCGKEHGNVLRILTDLREKDAAFVRALDALD